MKKLNLRRDELAKEYAYPDGPPKGQTCQFALERGYVDGFSAAIEELMPQVNKLVEAAKNIHLKYDEDVAFVGGISTLNDALTEWQQFIGDEK